MSFVKFLEDVAGVMSMNTNLKCVLGFRGVFDIEVYFLWRSDMMCRMGQDIPWAQHLAKHLQYIQPVLNLWTCVLISDVIIPKKLPFYEFDFVMLTFPLFLPKMHVLFVRCAVISLRSNWYHWRKLCKTLYEKVRYVPNCPM